MAKIIANFLDLNLTDEELNEILSQKHAMTNASDWGKVKDDGGDGHKNSVKISKFQGVLGDWVNYFSPEQTRKLDSMISFKFKPQDLVLTDDAATAIRLINKMGRLVEDRAIQSVPEKPSINGNEDNFLAGDMSTLGTWARAKRKFRKKPVFTKAEASFIRRKDRVVIVEERYQPDGPIERTSIWRRIFCCCSSRPGYTPF